VGLPRPAPGDVVRADDAPTFSEWKAFFPPEALNEQLLTQGARLFGEATSRLADWGMALHQAYIAAPRQILATPEVVAVTPGDQARFRSLGPFELKGIAAPVERSAAAPPG
jgi:hypothetical protein